MSPGSLVKLAPFISTLSAKWNLIGFSLFGRGWCKSASFIEKLLVVETGALYVTGLFVLRSHCKHLCPIWNSSLIHFFLTLLFTLSLKLQCELET